jgi:hypothetical protein
LVPDRVRIQHLARGDAASRTAERERRIGEW